MKKFLKFTIAMFLVAIIGYVVITALTNITLLRQMIWWSPSILIFFVTLGISLFVSALFFGGNKKPSEKYNQTSGETQKEGPVEEDDDIGDIVQDGKVFRKL